MWDRQIFVQARLAFGPAFWWAGGGDWRRGLDPRCLHFSSIYFARLDLGRFAAAGLDLHFLEERKPGEWSEAAEASEPSY
jgi:hypothetical protein